MSNDGGTGGAVGRTVGGRYRLLERIGSGGMGTVWRARDELMGREVAVKQPRLPGDPEDDFYRRAARRLHREARAAARVDHPSAVTIHDVVVEEGAGAAAEGGLPWTVMELIRGESLHEVLKRGPLEPAEAARIGLAVLGALRAAHAVGIVHRDVKPANVLLGPPPLPASSERGHPHGRVVLTDFGIAHIQGEEPLTASGEFVGSLEFVAPERLSGRGGGPASDLWSLGVLLYAAVEGCSPFRRTTVEATLAAIVAADPPEPEHAGPLGPLVVRLLIRDPERRPDPAEVAAALAAVKEGRPVPSPAGEAGPKRPYDERPAREGAAPEGAVGEAAERKRAAPEAGVPEPAERRKAAPEAAEPERTEPKATELGRAEPEPAEPARTKPEAVEPRNMSASSEFDENPTTIRVATAPQIPAPQNPAPQSPASRNPAALRNPVPPSTAPPGTPAAAAGHPRRRLPALALLTGLLAGGAWWGSALLGEGDSGAATERTVTDSDSDSGSTPTGPPGSSGSSAPALAGAQWVAHREAGLDAVLALPSRYRQSARQLGAGRQPRLVVYSAGSVDVRLTLWDEAPAAPMARADQAHETWNDHAPDARTQTTRTTFHGDQAALADTTYGLDGSPTRVMELFVRTADDRMYELRVDMPKGTPDEKQGTAVFKEARDRLEIGK